MSDVGTQHGDTQEATPAPGQTSLDPRQVPQPQIHAIIVRLSIPSLIMLTIAMAFAVAAGMLIAVDVISDAVADRINNAGLTQ